MKIRSTHLSPESAHAPELVSRLALLAGTLSSVCFRPDASLVTTKIYNVDFWAKNPGSPRSLLRGVVDLWQSPVLLLPQKLQAFFGDPWLDFEKGGA